MESTIKSGRAWFAIPRTQDVAACAANPLAAQRFAGGSAALHTFDAAERRPLAHRPRPTED